MKRRTPNKRRSKARSRNSSHKKYISPKTIEEFYAMPEKMQELYLAVLTLVGLMRRRMSRTCAMRELGLTRAQVDGFGSTAFRKLKNGRYVAKAYDGLLRVVMVVSEDGLREVATLDSRQASKAGRHSAAVQRYLQTGDDSVLTQFRGKYLIDAKGERVPFLTDLQELDRSGSAGILNFESLYARSL